ncbi:hypothetical protein FH972_003175 [Carpinus fangiana]|uniref:non-specific serine/threonine protein kinase n=1 Tax=Carpinus fangiana TaxID=176857 RepID=A0A5N6QKK9_9ROSI|nr:hypothetical protein FH972_003175 [Carpinus fangiana]
MGPTMSNGFPKSFYNCSKLVSLDVSQNNFVGKVLDDIHRMPGLHQLNIEGNNFSGNIPASIGRLIELRILQLSVCQFNNSFPPENGNLSNLERLELAYMTTIMPARLPSEFTKLKKLKFPKAFYNCSKLVSLDVSQNNFVGKVPDDIHRMPGLRQLNIEGNNFSGNIPASIRWLIELRILQLSACQFNNSFPLEIGNLSNLERRELAYMTTIMPARLPSEFTKLKKLKYLWVAGWSLVGEIPDTIGEMAALEYLDLARNNLSRNIPSSLFMLKNLSIVFLYINKLSGEIPRLDTSAFRMLPSEFTKKKLKYLWVAGSSLVGEIPDTIGETAALEYLDLARNNLSGNIPSSLFMLKNLSIVFLYINKLSGEIPRLVEALNIDVLDLSENYLTGSILDDFERLSKLSGTLPPDLGRCFMLEEFMVSSNKLTGKLPQHLGDNGRLIELIASDNNLSGQLPKSLGSCNNLIILRVENNRFSGNIPSGMWTLLSLSKLLLSNNSFTGELPERLSRNLSRLEMSHNKFSGNIPAGLTALPLLTTLLLDQNQLSVQLGRLAGISFLNLSSNHLTGRIPSGFLDGEYLRSFLNNPGLCASSSSINIDKCNSKSSKISVRFLVLIICSVIATLLLPLFFVIRVFVRRKQGLVLTWKLTSFHKLNFTGSDIMSGMTENNVIGRGGSGMVYRVAVNPSCDIAAVNPSCEIVAVKRIWNNGMLEHKLEKQFFAEVKTLSSIRHFKIVKLLCCISSGDSKLLVYEYLENGSLDLWLHRKSGASNVSDSVQQVNLDWPKRLQIVVGVA